MCKTPKAHENWGNGVACSQEKLKPCTNNHVKDLIPIWQRMTMTQMGSD